MSTNATSYFSNAYPGDNVLFDGNIFRADAIASPKYPVGFKVSRSDGSIFRYSHYGATCNRGVLVSPDINELNIPDTDNGMVAPASANDTTDGTIYSRFIQITMAGIVADQFKGGYLITTDGTGIGYTYRIKGNTATGSGVGSSTTAYRMELYEPLQIAIDSTTDYAIIGCQYYNLEIATTTDATVVGVSKVTIAVANPYAFTQTRGVCGVLLDASTVPAIDGAMMALSTLTAGAVCAYVGGTIGTVSVIADFRIRIVGYSLDQGDAAGQASIFLQCE
jgi:hypothetical protein